MNNLSEKDLKKFLNAAKKTRIAIIGDIMLDTFEYGTVTRTSPEANVPVILIDKIESMPGGAGNVARNIKHLGSNPILVSNTGDDEEGKILRKTLEFEKISTKGIFLNKKVTITKKRLLVDKKHFARVDKEVLTPSSKPEEQKIISYIKKNINKIDCLIFSDYCKGLITEKIVFEICKLANKRKIPIIVDAKPANADFYKKRNVSIITPNIHEATQMSGKKELSDIAIYLQDHFSSAVLITRGKHGMSLYADNQIVHVKAISKNVVDVSGCGDTVVATLAIAIASGMNIPQATYLSNYAAHITVQKPGTSTVTPIEFIESFKKYGK